MWLRRKTHDDLVAKNDLLQRLLLDSERDSSYFRAKYEALEINLEKQSYLISELTKEKNSLMNDLMVTSGVRMSKQQELLMEKQLRESSPNNNNSFTSQTRQWERQKMQEHLTLSDEERLKVMEELEKEMNAEG